MLSELIHILELTIENWNEMDEKTIRNNLDEIQNLLFERGDFNELLAVQHWSINKITHELLLILKILLNLYKTKKDWI